MSEPLDLYLSQSYRSDILGESLVVEMPAPEQKLITEIETELARIDRLGLGALLANRSFVTNQHKQALERLLRQLKAAQAAQPPQEG